ncbi:hypothetical protein EXIGLDRAFT_719745 [Exidia glandulosa HHB12029]|uniref:DUF7330 domain-containing protein n=1 Tax=Exidia glandulosa HHB12029 TaxID=1314781 RepID=A0A165GU61_EXIGL|nr:hypothetical protein EXIGLDRAFT_719745 [Exidia glandulosa HHB12029]
MIVDKKAADSDPPPYTPNLESGAPPNPNDASTVTAPPNVSRCNLLNIERSYNSITGTYVVDSTLVIPQSLLQPLSTEELESGGQRANLRLSAPYGRIKADVWMLDSPTQEPTRLMFNATSASVDLRLHDLGNAPCKVTVQSGYSSVKLTLPRDYVGPLSLRSKYGSVGPLPERVATLSDAGGERRCFVGDLRAMGNDGLWTGSTIEVTAPYSKITIEFIGDHPERSSWGSGWKSLLGLSA